MRVLPLLLVFLVSVLMLRRGRLYSPRRLLSRATGGGGISGYCCWLFGCSVGGAPMTLLLVVHMLVVRVVPRLLLVAGILMLRLQLLVRRMRCTLSVSLFNTSSRRRTDGALRLLIAHYKKL